MTAELALWALVVLPGVVGASLCLTGHRSQRIAAPVSVLTAAAGLALAAVVGAAGPAVEVAFVAGASFGLAVDALSGLVVVTVAAVTLLVLVFAAGDVADGQARFHGLMLLFLAAVLVTATATTLVTLLLAWEVMGAMSYALIGFDWRQRGNPEAGANAFLTTRTADLGLYVAAGAALAGGAGLALADLPAASTGWRHAIAAGVLVAALGKAAQLPFSLWLSRAMEGPSPVSALLHSAAMVAMGGYLLLRTHDLLAATGWAAQAAAWAGALTALLLGAVAIAQRDLKQLLAASTSAQLGFVVLAAGLGAVSAGAAHFAAHAATKALLFLIAGAWLSALGTKQLSALRGAARRWPLVGVTAGVGALALAGVAPLALWATKDEVLAVALEQSPALYVVGLAAAGLSAAYAGKVLLLVWARLPADTEAGYDDKAGFDVEQAGTRRVGWLKQLSLVVLAAGAAVLGALALPPLREPLRGALDDTGSATSTPVELLASAVLALAVLAATAVLLRRRRLPRPAWLAGWLGLGTATQTLVVRPVWWLARALARFDDRVVDRAVEATATRTVDAARRLGVADVRGVDGLVEAVARRTRALGDLARRPQTGQLHEYYVQTVAVLALGAVLLIALG